MPADADCDVCTKIMTVSKVEIKCKTKQNKGGFTLALEPEMGGRADTDED